MRELRNVVCRALLVRKGPQLDVSDLTFEEPLPRPPQPGAPLELPEGVTLEQMIQRLELEESKDVGALAILNDGNGSCQGS